MRQKECRPRLVAPRHTYSGDLDRKGWASYRGPRSTRHRGEGSGVPPGISIDPCSESDDGPYPGLRDCSMIGLVRLRPSEADGPGTLVLDRLPAVPAKRLSGALVRCGGEGELAEALSWYAEIRAVRPGFPSGLVCAPEICAGPLGQFTFPVAPLLTPGDLVNGEVPGFALAELRSVSVEGRLMDEVAVAHPSAVLDHREVIECLIAHAVRGGTLDTTARDLGCSTDTVRRRLGVHGIRPGALMRQLRLRAYDVRLELGEAPAAALAAGGWNSRKAQAKARYRLAKRGDPLSP